MISPRVLLAVNPELAGCAYAIFRDEILARAGIARAPWEASDLPAHRWGVAVDALLADSGFYAAEPAPESGFYASAPAPDRRAVVELPQVYDRARAKGDPNDLIRLAGLVGAVTRGVTVSGARCDLVSPHDWKGTVPKPSRAGGVYPIEIRVRRRLDAAELMRVEIPRNARLAWDVWDAVGIGLHTFGRWGR